MNSFRMSSPLKTGFAETNKALDQNNGRGPENSSTVPNFLLLNSTPAKTVGAQWGKSQTNLAAQQRELTHEHSRSWTKQKSKTHSQKTKSLNKIIFPIGVLQFKENSSTEKQLREQFLSPVPDPSIRNSGDFPGAQI